MRLLDGVEAGWAVALLLAGFVAVWMTYLLIAYLVGDLHSDVLEAWTFGRSFDWGSAKHPPLMGWVARAWTSVFPLTDWSLQLLALVNAAVALWFVDLISRRFVTGDKRVIVLLLLMLPPTYQFFAQRFNANAVLLPVWPAATYCFLRSFETWDVKWAVAAGATAALAMLGKYYSVFLIGSFVLAAICHPRRRAYFRSPAPWISAAVGLVALGPHLHWLATTGGMPFSYALREHGGKAFVPSLGEALLFIVEAALGLLLPALLWAAIAGRRLKMLPRDFLPMDPGLVLLFLIAVGTIAFPAIAAVVVGAHMPGVWASPGLFLFVVLVVCSTRFPIERFYTVNLLVIVAGMALTAAFIVAPLHAFYRNTHPLNEGRNFYRLSALELTRLWHRRFDIPLPIVGGDEGLALAAAFYSPDHPLYEAELVCPKTDEFPRAAIDRGWAALCFAGDSGCLDRMARNVAHAPGAMQTEFTVQSSLMGYPGAAQRVKAFIVPPSAAGMMAPMSAEDLQARRCKGGRRPDAVER
ncbi:MAG TPA: glycosyltransferase family 39 protein [Bradyrhizobium sp.]|uniref:glycosyltransferase family 39 protein n=1 Tax=Bradyrhizobium sp. TaxID=376 RepID=UPI002D8012DD|nr:glycosyltransferase family 39 protein [Bradyrhizobium sp.]HET7889272.1 glycosyltransferase family 39 protein [Bradyrhizobium sp.]